MSFIEGGLLFGNLAKITATLHAEILSFYWVLLVPLLAIRLCFEFLNKKNPDPLDVVRRVFISLLLLWSFDPTVDLIASISEALLSKISPHSDGWAVLETLGPGDDLGLFDVKSHMIYALAMLSYLVAYLGFFMAEAITQFLWAILYVMSPLMILCYVSATTAPITISLYKSLCRIATWEILWTILGAMLLSLADSQHLDGMEEFLRTIVVNFCIGAAMLVIPLAAKSLLSDGMESVSASTAATLLAVTKIKTMGIARLPSRKILSKTLKRKEPLNDRKPFQKTRPHRSMDKAMQRPKHSQTNPGPPVPSKPGPRRSSSPSNPKAPDLSREGR